MLLSFADFMYKKILHGLNIMFATEQLNKIQWNQLDMIVILLAKEFLPYEIIIF